MKKRWVLEAIGLLVAVWFYAYWPQYVFLGAGWRGDCYVAYRSHFPCCGGCGNSDFCPSDGRTSPQIGLVFSADASPQSSERRMTFEFFV